MKSKQYRAEVKTRAIELLIESQKDYPSMWAAIQAIAPKFGCTPETLRSWHQKHLAKQNPSIVEQQSQAERIKQLERENKELQQINEILRKATAFFAQTELGNLPNLTILRLLPYSPELNPIEQVWQYIKQHWLSNRCFDSYEAIVDAACQAWCNFAKQVATVKSLTARHWAVL